MRRSAFTLVAALALCSWACEKKTPQPADSQTTGTETQPSTGAAPTRDTILIGEVGSLTGNEATFGISTRNGIDLAIQQANAEGGVNGKKIEIRVYDDQGKPEEAASAITRLITQDQVVLVLGEVASTNPKVTQKGDYIFRICFIDPFQGFVMAKFARENLKLNNVAVLQDNKSDYSLGLSEVFTRSFSQMGGKITATESYSKGDTDFRAQLTAIKSGNPEAIYVPGYYSDVGLIARQARQLGLKVPLLGGDGWESEKLYELGGSAINGSYFSNHYSPENPQPMTQKFIEDYKKQFGAVPDSLAALGFDAARVAVAAMRKAKDLSGPALRDAIAQTKEFPGAAGTISLDDNRNAVKPAVILQVKDGKATFVTSIDPRS